MNKVKTSVKSLAVKAKNTYETTKTVATIVGTSIIASTAQDILIMFARNKYKKQPNPNQRKGAENRGSDPDAPGKNDIHSDKHGGEQHSQKAKGSHGLPKNKYGGR